MSLCCLNGQILPLAEARIDPLDRGYLFGDALYEAVKVLDGVILHLDPHLERLRRGLERTGIPLPRGLASDCQELTHASSLQSGYLYIQVSRGVTSRAHIPPDDLEPTVLILPFSQSFYPPAGRLLRAVTVPDWRWEFCDIKTTSLMATVLGKLRAGQGDVEEVLFLGPDRELREGGSTTLFVRHTDSWETHPTDGTILEGVTRQTILHLAVQEGMAVALRAPLLAELEQWSEAFLCGTTTGVQPLVEIDGRQVGDGVAGAWTERLAAAFDRLERGLVARAVAR